MFLPKDHAAFEIDRKRLAVWTDIRHLQWGFAQRREYGELRQHGRTLQRKWLGLFYPEVRQNRERCHVSGQQNRVQPSKRVQHPTLDHFYIPTECAFPGTSNSETPTSLYLISPRNSPSETGT